MRTWGEERATGTWLLRSAGVETATLDADVLLAHVAGIEKEELYAHPETPTTRGQRERYHELLARRAEGEPVAYLRGWKEFYGLQFAVDRRVLVPRPETEVLVDAAREAIALTGAMMVADVGTGSGAIAVALAVNDARLRVIATDVSADALAVARENARSHRLARRVEFRQGDLVAPLVEPVPVIVANLPYLRDDSVERWVGERSSRAFEPHVAVVAGADGLALIRRCVAELPRVLAAGGVALFEVDPPQAGQVRELLAPLGAVRVLRDLSGGDRVVGVRRE